MQRKRWGLLSGFCGLISEQVGNPGGEVFRFPQLVMNSVQFLGREPLAALPYRGVVYVAGQCIEFQILVIVMGVKRGRPLIRIGFIKFPDVPTALDNVLGQQAQNFIFLCNFGFVRFYHQ